MEQGKALMETFWRLHGTRGGGMGPGPITYQELSAYMQLTGDWLSAWEVRQIKMLDGMYLSAFAEMQRNTK